MNATLYAVLVVSNTNSNSQQDTAVQITLYESKGKGLSGINSFYNYYENQPNKIVACFDTLIEFVIWFKEWNRHGNNDLYFICSDNNINSSLVKVLKNYLILKPKWNALVQRFIRSANAKGTEWKIEANVHLEKLFTSRFGNNTLLLRKQAEFLIPLLSIKTMTLNMFSVFFVKLKMGDGQLLYSQTKLDLNELIRTSGMSSVIGKQVKQKKKRGRISDNSLIENEKLSPSNNSF